MPSNLSPTNPLITAVLGMVNNRKKQLVTRLILSASPPIRIIPRLPNGLYPLAQQTLITQPRLGSTDLTLAGVISQKACGDVPPFKINKYIGGRGKM